MSSPRPLAYALGIAAALAGISVYLTVTAEARPVEDAALDEAAEGGSTPVSGEPDLEAELDVFVTTRRFGRSVAGVEIARWPAVAQFDQRTHEVNTSVVAGSPSSSGRRMFALEFEDGTTVRRIVDGSEGRIDEFDLVTAAEIRGRVTDRGGAPIADVVVWNGDSVGDERVTTTTDEHGEFVIRSRCGGSGIPVVFQRAGYVPTFRTVDAGADYVQLRVRLEPSRTVTVQLAARVDEPERAELTLVPRSHEDCWVHYPAFAMPSRQLDSAGRLELDGMPNRGVVALGVCHPEIATTIQVVDLQKRLDGDVTLAAAIPTAFLRGRVVAADGEPIAGARVRLRQPGHRGAPTRLEYPLVTVPWQFDCLAFGYTEVDGTYALVAPNPEDAPRRSQLVVDAEGYIPVTTDPDAARRIVLLENRDMTSELLLELGQLGRNGNIRIDGGGWVTWSDDAPFTIPFAEPGVFEVSVLAVRGDEVVLERSFETFAVNGRVTLDLRP